MVRNVNCGSCGVAANIPLGEFVFLCPSCPDIIEAHTVWNERPLTLEDIQIQRKLIGGRISKLKRESKQLTSEIGREGTAGLHKLYQDRIRNIQQTSLRLEDCLELLNRKEVELKPFKSEMMEKNKVLKLLKKRVMTESVLHMKIYKLRKENEELADKIDEKIEVITKITQQLVSSETKRLQEFLQKDSQNRKEEDQEAAYKLLEDKYKRMQLDMIRIKENEEKFMRMHSDTRFNLLQRLESLEKENKELKEYKREEGDQKMKENRQECLETSEKEMDSIGKTVGNLDAAFLEQNSLPEEKQKPVGENFVGENEGKGEKDIDDLEEEDEPENILEEVKNKSFTSCGDSWDCDCEELEEEAQEEEGKNFGSNLDQIQPENGLERKNEENKDFEETSAKENEVSKPTSRYLDQIQAKFQEFTEKQLELLKNISKSFQ